MGPTDRSDDGNGCERVWYADSEYSFVLNGGCELLAQPSDASIWRVKRPSKKSEPER
jgi:hypothetical protein